MTTNEDKRGYFERLVDSIMPGSALDVGCGKGAYTLHLLEKDWKVTAYDRDQTCLAHVLQESQDAVGLSTETLDLNTHAPTERADLIVCAYVLHFLPKNRALDILHAFVECLNPGGFLYLRTWAPQGLMYETAKSHPHASGEWFFADKTDLSTTLNMLTPIYPISPRTVSCCKQQGTNIVYCGVWQKRP